MSRRQRRHDAAPDGSARCVVDGSARWVVDYALARRAALAALAAGRARSADVCDAHAYLLRAARYHGERADWPCPVCGDAGLVTVTYTYGECFRPEVNGRARATRELVAMAGEFPDFSVHVVEVCAACRWNHLLTSYVLGTGEQVRRRARS